MNTAYAFMNKENRPKGHVDGCKLLWRLIWCGFWKTVLNVFFLLVFIPFVILLWVIWLPYIWLAGRSIYFADRVSQSELANTTIDWKITSKVPRTFFPFLYRSEINRDLPNIFGYRLTPGVVLLCLAFLAGEVLLVVHIGSLGAHDVLTLGDWGLRLMLAQLSIGVVALLVLIGLLIRRGEAGQLIAANWKSFKERTCPVVEIVG